MKLVCFVFMISLSTATRLWTNTVPYVIDDVPRDYRIIESLRYVSEKTNFNFKQHSDENDYILFKRSSNGCNAMLGRGEGGAREVNIGDGCSIPIVIHEIRHVLGLPHEHQRFDRDFYIRVNYDNIQNDRKNNFLKMDPRHYTTPYDYHSIMHYSEGFFSINGKKTLEVINISDVKCTIGNNNVLSEFDIIELNELCGNCSNKNIIYKQPLEFCGGIKFRDTNLYGTYEDYKLKWGSMVVKNVYRPFRRNRYEIIDRYLLYDYTWAYSYDQIDWYIRDNGRFRYDPSNRFNKILKLDQSWLVHELIIMIVAIAIIVIVCLLFIKKCLF